jgi:hypothetical protein
LLQLATERPGGDYTVAMDSPAWKEQYDDHGLNLTYALRDLSARRLAKLIDKGQTYRIYRHGYQELTRFLANAQTAAALAPSLQDRATAFDGSGRDGSRRRSRGEIIEAMVGAPGAIPPASAPAGDRVFSRPAATAGHDQPPPARRESAERGREFLDRLRGLNR